MRNESTHESTHASTHESTLRWGAAVFGAAMAAFGAMSLVRLDGVPAIEPLPAGLPGRAAWAAAGGAVLLAAGAALAADRRARDGARVVAAILTLWLVALHGPGMAADPTNGAVWVPACEVLSLGAAAWLLAAALGGRDLAPARLLFGATFLAYGYSHVRYLGYVESVIPAWLPAPRFWALATAAAHAAAGVALLTGVRARLAARLLALMFASWVAIVHLPRVAANPAANEWASLFVALAMCGASLVTAATLGAVRHPAAAGPAAERPALVTP